MHRVAGGALHRVALLFFAALLSACTTLGPDYREPELDWLKDWQPALYGRIGAAGVQKTVDLRFWWRLFDDPALDRLNDAARADNLGLRIAGLRVLESRALLGIAGSSLYPQVQQVSGAISYVNTQNYGGSSSAGDQSLGSYQVGFNLAWELDFWGRFKRGIESADAAFFASIANQQDAQVLLSAQAVDLYYAYRTANNIRLQDARLQQLIENYRQVALQAAREIEDAGISVVKTAERQVILDQTVDAAQRALALANTRYREGYADFQRVLDAQRSLFSQAERQLINQGTHVSAAISLYKGLGGGWVSMPIDQLIPEDVRDEMRACSDWGNLLSAPLPDQQDKALATSGASEK